MSDDENFLSRWSRRKRAARAGRIDAENLAAAPAAEADRSEGLPSEAEAEPALSPEELARLPKIEDLTAETDLGQFLRPGVPQALRNAALRHAWALDPAIRDHVGEARDYAYDWNLPGGVPGSGPPPSEAEARELLRRVSGDRPAELPAEAPPEQPAAASGNTPEPAANADPPAASAAAASEPQTPPRRHGGATPG
jgi:uncharacterized protein DUF3306